MDIKTTARLRLHWRVLLQTLDLDWLRPRRARPELLNRQACSSGVTAAPYFSGTGSSDSDGTIASYSWTFGDGGTSTAATVAHTYRS